MKAQILESFGINLGRVRNLLSNYTTITGAGSGRRATEDTDLLRAAVVFLHATLEEVLRELERWKLPGAPQDQLKNVPLKGLSQTGRAEKFWLSDLATFRGQGVDQVIAESIDEMLDRSNYNDLGDVSRVLALAGVNDVAVDAAKARLAPAMARRHKIVHQADRQDQPGKGFGPATPIDKPTVSDWIDDVEHFVTEVFKHL
ncbi:MAG: hypothetical protein HUU19_01530 [Phycisphaerales bacterium]|nr:hypothetical protein [Phycisphaerales bacterium]